MSFEVAKEKAIRYIALSRKTSYEVKAKLSKIGVDEEIIDQVIEYLVDLDYINDEEYVDAYVRQCMRLQNHSIYEIKNKLLQKGIKKDIIETKLDKLSNTDYEEKIIKKLFEGKLNSYDELRKKQYLYRRGFKNF